jgi:hypothetical protein
MTLCPPCGAASFWTGPEGAAPDGARSHLGLHHKFGEAGRGTPLPGKTVQSRGDPAEDPLRFGGPRAHRELQSRESRAITSRTPERGPVLLEPRLHWNSLPPM